MISSTLRIPLERIAVLIGQKGNVKRKIERRGKVRLDIKWGDFGLPFFISTMRAEACSPPAKLGPCIA